MRKGYNPHKDKKQEEASYLHQIIIPVYIPNEKGYFKDTFKILELCLQSLFKTVHSKTFITVVNNGSNTKVVNYLNDLYIKEHIHELIHTSNIGKLNAILKGLAGNNIELVTIADADVLFLNDWQSETVNVFNSYSKAGVVGLVPQFKLFESNCGNVLFENFFSKKMKFSKVKNKKALIYFYESIGWDKNYNQDYLKQQLTISSNNCTAIVGSGHFVATYKKEVFDEIVTYIGYKMGGNSESYLDKAPLYKGLWRLTTQDNFAYHMGNVVEPWMDDVLKKIKNNPNTLLKLENTKTSKKISKFHYFIKNRLFTKLFSYKIVKQLFYRYKKLPKEMISNY
jgi:hypothetical protein